MKKKLLTVIPTMVLLVTPLATGVSPADAATKAPNQKVVAKAETRPTLRLGSQSSYVKELQQILKNAKYNVTVDGVFGPKTEAAVKQFQADHNLSADGIVGAMTWKVLDQIGSVTTPETRPTLRVGSQSNYVKELQQILKDVKYDAGVDGIFGSKTQTMVKQFQAEHNLSSDGIVGAMTWKALDQNKVERQQFTVNTAIALGQKKLGNTIIFSGDGRLLKDSKKQSYYRFKAANKDWIEQGGTGTIGWYHIYKDGRVVAE
ncbi:peptidoglycan-binding domain-containing protein [Priestia aryabhattai]|uniref:peptidoglycan-binding domain-containing protein n=1 Tax=Priestia aryabhattai TaxID=412384 RepID=UPI002377D8C7|nr:peptidoglycan-binding protein [Priestia aryabhattai]